MARRTKEEAAETRGQILAAALEVFSEKGYSRTTFVDIANHIGLSKGAVYWHFKTKPDLLAALIRHGDEKQCNQVMSCKPTSMAEFRETIAEMAKETILDESRRRFEFFTGFQIEWSEQLLAEVQGKLSAMRGNPIDDYTRTLLHLQGIGELDAGADIQMMAMVTAATWVGALRLALSGDVPLEFFPEMVLHNFDVFADRFSNRKKMSGE